MKRLLEEAKKIIRIHSVSSDGNEEIANYVAGLLRDRGLKVSLQHVTHSLENVSKRQFNVLGILGDSLVDKKIRKGLLLNTHLDTVSPGIIENWTETNGDPYSATIKEGKIFGLGAADVKLDFLCKLHAVSKFKEKKLKQPIYLVGTCGEEIGMFGVKYLIKSLSLNPKFVMVGEPSNLKVVYAHKCLNVFRVSIGYHQIERDARGFNRRIELHSFGKSAHSSYPDLGVNAIHSGLSFLHRAVESGFEIRFTEFDGGDTVNKVPDHAMMTFYVTSHQLEDFKRFFREAVRTAELEKAFRVELGGVGDTGVKLLPDALFHCIMDVTNFFKSVAQDFEKVKDESYRPSHSTVNCGKIKHRLGGVDIHFDMRLLPDLIPDEVEKHVQQGIQKIAKDYPSLNVNAVLERSNPGLNMTPQHELMKLCRDAMEAAKIDVQFDKKATSTEAAQYFTAGYESVVFGPGLSAGNSHSPNEHNLVEHLEKATAFYEKLIERVCL